LAHDVPCLTTLSAAWAAIQAIRTLQAHPLDVCALQDLDALKAQSDLFEKSPED
jgi:hypothetical protein